MERFKITQIVKKKITHDIEAENLIDALCDVVKKGINLQDIYPEGFGFRLSICGCFFITKPNGKQCLIEKDGTLFKDDKGRTEFDYMCRYIDGSTKIRVNGKYSLIEKDGTLFKDDKGRTEFDYMCKYTDGSTQIEIKEKQYLIEKDGTLFKDDKGRTEFDYMCRYIDGSTEIEIKGKWSLVEKDEKCIKDIKENRKICKELEN